ncbi:MAG TPA: baseplate J/gp47 family protein, partial [Acidimicrobiales bacterium]|nr:baseplate J/gp47 family protein [Acidimicrobiales bacterium]
MDRLAAIIQSTKWNGIDWVEVPCDDETTLRVHFLNTVAVTLVGQQPVTITGTGPVPVVTVAPVTSADWSVTDEGRPVLTLHAQTEGDFSEYELSIAAEGLDSWFSRVRFSFKAGCPSTMDCASACPTCPTDDEPLPPIDYLAKDFNSFRKALSDYATLAYPGWVERDEADLGMVMMELLAATADELSYLQDRVASEAAFATCTERRSLVRHARLVDYEPAPAMSAQVLVQVDVQSGPLPSGAVVFAPLADGTTISFEIGEGLANPTSGVVSTSTWAVDPRWNALDRSSTASPENPWRILPYWWDDSEQCLPAGSTEMWVLGHGYGFVTGDTAAGKPGTALLIETAALSPLDQPAREVVQLVSVDEETDPLVGTLLTHLTWDASQALRVDHDLPRTHLAGNLLPATEGQRYQEDFAVLPAPGAPLGTLPAVARPGPNATCTSTAPIFAHTLNGGRLAWLPPGLGSQNLLSLAGNGTTPAPGPPPVPGAVDALPEIVVTELAASPEGQDVTWQWWRSLLEAPALPDRPGYTVDPVSFRDIRPPSQRQTGGPVWDYDGDGGDSVRFGDDVFGQRPSAGTVFRVTYRTTHGAAGNVAAGTVTGFDPSLGAVMLSVTNPFPALGGADEEPAELVRRRAPYAFRAVQYRAVRPEDYEAAAQTLPCVQRAGTNMRWTGSWLTVFTAAEPTDQHAGGLLSVPDQVQLVELLDRYRLAGYESYLVAPRYAGMDIVVDVCAQPWAFASNVEAAVRTELGTALNASGSPAFFEPSQWTFGHPLQRSCLEAAAQAALGVEGVVQVSYRWRGVTDG